MQELQLFLGRLEYPDNRTVNHNINSPYQQRRPLGRRFCLCAQTDTDIQTLSCANGKFWPIADLRLKAPAISSMYRLKSAERQETTTPAIQPKFRNGNYAAKTVIPLSVRFSADPRTVMERRAAMTLVKRLPQVFNIDVETCRACGGTAKVIACIEDPVVIERILSHLNEKAPSAETTLLPESRAPPHAGLFD